MATKFFKFLSLFILALFTQNAQANKHTMSNDNDPKYASEWSKVDSLEKKGLYRMALEEVNKIFLDAADKKAHNQVIKAVMYELKYNSYLEEDDYVLGIYKLEELIKTSPSPSKEIFHSLLAEVYWGYYSSNSWKYNDRTSVANVELKDIRTWDLKRIAHRIRHHYAQSLLNDKYAKAASIKDFTEIILDSDETASIRPTLYDFLAYRALDFFKSTTFDLGGSATTFVLDDPDFFGTNSTFLKVNAISLDSLNTRFLAVQVYRLLTNFHLSQNDKEPLFAVALDRLAFFKDYAVMENKDELYYEAITRLAESFKAYPFAAEAYYAQAKYHAENGGNSVAYNTESKAKKSNKIAFDICEKTIDKYPNTYGAKQCQSLKSQLLLKELSISSENAIIPNTITKVLIDYKNINKAYLKIVKFDPNKRDKNRYSGDRLIDELGKRKAVYEKELDLTDPKDFNNHSIEVMIPKLEKGFYYVVLSSAKNFKGEEEAVTYLPFWSTSITYQDRKNNGFNEVLVSDRKTGKPLEGAKVEVFYEKYNYTLRKYEQKTLGKFVTNKEGVIKFDPKGNHHNYSLEIAYDNEIYLPNANIYSYRDYNDTDRKVEIQFFTDRKIYRPGQTIFFKGIAFEKLKKERSLLKNYETTVIFYDVNSQEIDRKKVTTNQFGSFEGEFKAPFGVLTGMMRLADNDRYGATNFRVEEYKRPKFNVEMNPVKGEFKVNDIISTTGFAKAFAGNPIDGAEVTYRVVRSVSYNNWNWWSWYSPAEPKEITQGKLVTDKNGEFKIDFEAMPDRESDPKNLPIFEYTVYVDVTDINGETRSTSQTIVAGYQSLQLGQNIASDLNNADDFTLILSTTNLNGQKIGAKGEIKIDQLEMPNQPFYSREWQKPDMQNWSEEEFKKLYPNEAYGDEDQQQNWAVKETVFKGIFNTNNTDSVAIPTFKNWKPGVYKYQATATDKNGIAVKDVFYFTVFSPKAKQSPTNDLLWIKPLKPSAEPGEKLTLLLASSEKNVVVRYDLEANGKIIESNTIKLSDEQKEIIISVKEAYRGNFTVHFSALKNNRFVNKSITTIVPYTNKELDLSFATFRNKLLPGQNEEWILTIKNKYGEKEQAELLATLYDASLDPLYTPNSFYMNVYQTFYGNKGWSNPVEMSFSRGYNMHYYWNTTESMPYRTYPRLNYFGWQPYYYYYGGYARGGMHDLEVEESEVMLESAPPSPSKGKFKKSKIASANSDQFEAKDEKDAGIVQQDKSKRDENVPANEPTNGTVENNLSTVSARTNFNETAFFYPQLTTDKKGNVSIKFTIPESLTKWRFLGLAHTKDLKIGTIDQTVVTQKELMVVPNAPRFLREGDVISISAKVSNISDEDLAGKAQLTLVDPFTEKPIDAQFELTNAERTFTAKKGESTVVSWTLKVPYTVSTVKYKIVARAGNFSDGEENVLPILSNRMLVTESMPMPIRGNETKSFTFDKLKNSSKSNTLRHHRYTLEFTSNPAWYAIQAMPYMMEYPHECAEQVFTRYYSNAIASHIMTSNPKIKTVIDKWKTESPDAFLSNLQKNQELKAVLLEETPWVLAAQDEEESKRNLAVLLDMNRMASELDKALGKTIQTQASNGGWPWFPGMPESRYITQHIVTGMGHLDHLGIKAVREDSKVWRMIEKAVNYLDGEIVSDFKNAKRWDKDYLKNQHIGYTQIQYLYARSYFPELEMDSKTKEAVNYYKDQATEYWLQFNIYAEGMIALAAHRFKMETLATDIVKSLKDRSIQHEEFGMYWKDYQLGYYWYQAPIEAQALMIEVFNDITNDQESVDELKIWLLKQKQTTNWKTTKQTTEAVYALLLTGSDLLASDDLVTISVGGNKIKYVDNPNPQIPYEVKAEAGTGYFKTAWDIDQIDSDMADITVTKKDKGVAWGAAYWQYFEDLDKITFAETNLKLKKDLYTVEVTQDGEQLQQITAENVLEVGDKIRVRIELRTDRNLEYVHLKDMRAAGFEPIDVLSSYRYQDGLGYYQSSKDAATHFFFDYIRKGTYVFEYDLRVQHKGDFSNGIATIQCMYAPEFTSHSDGIRVSVK